MTENKYILEIYKTYLTFVQLLYFNSKCYEVQIAAENNYAICLKIFREPGKKFIAPRPIVQKFKNFARNLFLGKQNLFSCNSLEIQPLRSPKT